VKLLAGTLVAVSIYIVVFKSIGYMPYANWLLLMAGLLVVDSKTKS
jgi:hypothetical protein